jgi:hypothetical protein
MSLSKLELQQMLREMNVKFGADESVDELKRRLQQQNHSLWLKSVNADRVSADRSGTVVIRKRKDLVPPQEPVIDKQADASSPQPKAGTASRDPDRRRQRSESPRHRHAIEKPAPGKPWKAAAEGTQPFNRKKNVFASVLRRARTCCELCGIAGDAANATSDLHPFHIQSLDEGGEHSVKNVVALCPACLAFVQENASLKVIKELKRKTRSRLYHSLKVEKKRKGLGRKAYPRRSKS